MKVEEDGREEEGGEGDRWISEGIGKSGTDQATRPADEPTSTLGSFVVTYSGAGCSISDSVQYDMVARGHGARNSGERVAHDD